MEREHRARILARFRSLWELPPIEVLDVPDDYGFMDDELVEMLRPQIESFVVRACSS